jgi:hypothetical protein
MQIAFVNSVTQICVQSDYSCLQAMLDTDRGISAMIAGTNYSVKQPASSYQPWAEGVCRSYRIFQEQVAASGLPAEIQKQVRGCMLLPLNVVQHTFLRKPV